MKSFAILLISALAIVAFIFIIQRSSKNDISNPLSMGNIILKSSAFKNNEPIPAKYTCDGDPPAGGINPPLEIENVPSGAKSLVLIVDDPDAPRGDWVHWTLWNVAVATKEIAEDSIPAGAVQGMTDFGKPGYGGPCPPSGTHHYQFKLYALDVTLNLPPSASKSQIEDAIQGYILGQTVLIGLYSRK